MSLLYTATEDRTGIMSSLASRRVGNCDEPLARDLAKLEIVVHDDDNEEHTDGGDLTLTREDANNNSLVEQDEDVREDETPTPVPSDPEDEDYKPVVQVKVKWEPEKQLKTRGNDATKWETIGAKLLKFKDPPDPLQPYLEEIFNKVVAAQFYTGRAQIRDLCKMMNLSDAQREKVLDKATKKLSNVLKNTK